MDRKTPRLITSKIFKKICTGKHKNNNIENNHCTFNDEFYKQISETAMGTIFAPTYATLTMGYFEVHFYNICELKWGKEFQEFILENWSRSLDDCQTPLNLRSY